MNEGDKAAKIAKSIGRSIIEGFLSMQYHQIQQLKVHRNISIIDGDRAPRDILQAVKDCCNLSS